MTKGGGGGEEGRKGMTKGGGKRGEEGHDRREGEGVSGILTYPIFPP